MFLVIFIKFINSKKKIQRKTDYLNVLTHKKIKYYEI